MNKHNSKYEEIWMCNMSFTWNLHISNESLQDSAFKQLQHHETIRWIPKKYIANDSFICLKLVWKLISFHEMKCIQK